MRHLISHVVSIRAAICVAGSALVMCAGASAQLTTWDYGGSALQYTSNSEGDYTWVSYQPGPTVGATPLVDGIKMYGTGDNDNAFSQTGLSYIPSDSHDPNTSDFVGNRLLMFGQGTINGAAWVHPDDIVRTTFNFGFGFSGGILDVYAVQTGFTLLDPNGDFVTGVGSGTSLGAYEPGGYGLGFAFEDRFGADISTATTILWTVEIRYDWTGMAEGDTLAFDIPQNSIDINVVPEPASIALLALGGVMLRRRR